MILLRRRRARTPEGALKAAIRDLAHFRGWVYFPLVQGIGSRAGAPDLMLGSTGGWVAVEVKSPRGRLSAAQGAFADDCRALGLPYLVVRDVLELDRWMRRFEAIKLGRAS